MDQPGMALTGVAGRVDDARHLDAQGEVLAETVADARRHRYAACCGFLLQESVVGWIDPAVDQSSESAHRNPPKRCRNRAANAEHLRNRVFRELARAGSEFRDSWSSTLSCSKTRCLLTVSIPRLLRGDEPDAALGLDPHQHARITLVADRQVVGPRACTADGLRVSLSCALG